MYFSFFSKLKMCNIKYNLYYMYALALRGGRGKFVFRNPYIRGEQICELFDMNLEHEIDHE